MAHYLVRQLRFARSEFARCLEGVTEAEGLEHIGKMNSLGWIVGHLANHEHFLWVRAAQGLDLFPELNELVGYGKPASTPSLKEMWETKQAIATCADEYLETLTGEKLGGYLELNGKTLGENIGTCIMRNTYHIWFHLGEAHAIRQGLGHNPPDFVGPFGEAGFFSGNLSG
jgi:hypothetical protein